MTTITPTPATAKKPKPKAKKLSPWRYSSFAKDNSGERIIPVSARMGITCPR